MEVTGRGEEDGEDMMKEGREGETRTEEERRAGEEKGKEITKKRIGDKDKRQHND